MKEKLEYLLRDLATQYEKSDNKQHYNEKRKWGYELIQSYLEKSQPLIIGFNWGVDNRWDKYKQGIEYKHKNKIERMKFTEIYKGSLQRAMNMAKLYFSHISFEKGSHSNFCFFRSEKENQITEFDIKLCERIFIKMIDIVNPSVVFCFSDRARKYLFKSGLLQDYNEERFFLQGSKSCLSAKAKLYNGTKIFFLPHPNRPIKRELRHKAWKYCADFEETK